MVLTGNKRVELSTLFIFVKMMVYIYILLVYNSDQEVEVKPQLYMQKENDI